MKIIVDTREKHFWDFSSIEGVEVVVQKLDTGDYSLDWLEYDFCIERKKSVSEIASNLTDKRFWAEMERMREFRYKFLLCEFSMDDILIYPKNSGIPKSKLYKIKIRAPYILSRLAQIQVDYGVHVIFAGDASNAQTLALNIMKKVYEQEESKRK